jgi:hypothetical protein
MKIPYINKSLLILLIIVVSASVMFFISGYSQNNITACTFEAKICPDGSSVGRVPPACEFALCPTTPPLLCPKTEWVNCMPGPDKIKSECNSQYLEWAKKNCPDFKGAAY